ncbi:hypothetical protein R0K04_29035, partial [Pseudoalteromonas sp. SIMBA_153]
VSTIVFAPEINITALMLTIALIKKYDATSISVNIELGTTIRRKDCSHESPSKEAVVSQPKFIFDSAFLLMR